MAQLTIADNEPRVQYTVGSSASTGPFAIPFEFFDNSDIKVIITDTTTLADTTLAQHPSGFTITATAADDGFLKDGSLTLAASVTNSRVTIYADYALTKTTNFPLSGAFDIASLNTQISRVFAALKQQSLTLARTIAFSRSDATSAFTVPADRANKILSFDSNSDLTATQEIGTFKGDWAASTAYTVRDLVKDTSTNNVFICVTAHTSSGAQPLTTNTDSAKWTLIVDAASATTSQTAAASSATAAASSATSSASSAATSTAQASTATTQAGLATTAKTAAETAKAAAETAQAAAETALDNFDDIYLGAKSSDPATDNDGDALNAGDQYFNTSTNTLKIYNGSSWQAAALDANSFVSKTSGTGAAQLPSGTTGQRDGSPAAGYLRFNSTATAFEGYDGSAWGAIGGGGPALDGGGTGEESVIRVNKNQISGSVSLTIASGDNGMSAGPVTITSGSSVTVSSGATWHIVGT